MVGAVTSLPPVAVSLSMTGRSRERGGRRAPMAAAFGPFVALLGEHGAEEADQRVAVGKDADYVGAPADLAVEPLAGVVGPDLPPDLFGKGGEGEHVGASGLHMLGRLSAACRPARRAPGRTSAAAANVCLVGGGVEVPRGVE